MDNLGDWLALAALIVALGAFLMAACALSTAESTSRRWLGRGQMTRDEWVEFGDQD